MKGFVRVKDNKENAEEENEKIANYEFLFKKLNF